MSAPSSSQKKKEQRQVKAARQQLEAVTVYWNDNFRAPWNGSVPDDTHGSGFRNCKKFTRQYKYRWLCKGHRNNNGKCDSASTYPWFRQEVPRNSLSFSIDSESTLGSDIADFNTVEDGIESDQEGYKSDVAKPAVDFSGGKAAAIEATKSTEEGALAAILARLDSMNSEQQSMKAMADGLVKYSEQLPFIKRAPTVKDRLQRSQPGWKFDKCPRCQADKDINAKACFIALLDAEAAAAAVK